MNRTHLVRHRTAYAIGVMSAAAAVWWVGRADHVDLDVYRRAGLRWLANTDPYAVRPELPFTYPPFAAVLASLVTVAPVVALAVLSLATVGAVTGGVLAAAAPDGRRLARRSPKLVGVLLAAVVCEPVLRGLALGQVNGLVVGLVLVDLLVVPTRWRGWLTGVAAGVKLTPLVFIMHLLARRQYSAAGRLAAAFAGTVLVGVVALPDATDRYWSSLVLDAGRVGAPGFVDNQSLLGAATRLAPAGAVALWLASGVVVTAVGALAIARSRARPPIEGVVVCALVALLVSPISWSHHWLLLPAAAVLCWRHGRRMVGATAFTVAIIAPHWRFARSSIDTAAASAATLVGATSMTAVGLACLIALSLPPRPARARGCNAVTGEPVENGRHVQDWVGDGRATPRMPQPSPAGSIVRPSHDRRR